MAKYKPNTAKQGQFFSLFLDDQLLPGTFEHSLARLIDQELELSIFDNRYRNDAGGARAYNPRVLLKIILFAYSRGITSSRQIARCCQENIIFMALSGNTHPHFTTIADFIATMQDEIIPFFRTVLLICDNMGLIGKEMFAIDGCKMPSNAGKEWSGTKLELERKAQKIEDSITRIMQQHQDNDCETDQRCKDKKDQYIDKLEKHVRKIRNWSLLQNAQNM